MGVEYACGTLACRCEGAEGVGAGHAEVPTGEGGAKVGCRGGDDWRPLRSRPCSPLRV